LDRAYVRVNDKKTDEVQDLQPLFEKGLWLFGPEFETIEYTSNQGMTKVVQELFKQSAMKGSRNRPDFAVLPDGTCGLYAYPRYDDDGGELGTDRLVVIELKKPGVRIGQDEKQQCWKYLKELFSKGLLQERLTIVRCFVLGSQVDEFEHSPFETMEGTVRITPMLFDTAMQRARSRLLKLHQRVKNAPFLQAHREEIEAFLAEDSAELTDRNLFAQETAERAAT